MGCNVIWGFNLIMDSSSCLSVSGKAVEYLMRLMNNSSLRNTAQKSIYIDEKKILEVKRYMYCISSIIYDFLSFSQCRPKLIFDRVDIIHLCLLVLLTLLRLDGFPCGCSRRGKYTQILYLRNSSK